LEGLDYTDTFSPVAKLVTLKCLLVVAVVRHWPLHQLNVQNAFLHGDLNEEVYMQPPPGLPRQGANIVCRLQKSIYGLKQASRNWFSKFSTAIKSFGFQQSKADYSLFTKVQGASFTAILLYVDDMIITGNDTATVGKLKRFLHNHFRIKDLGNLKYFLGIEVAYFKQGIAISQRKYTLDILKDAGMIGSRTTKIPMEQNQRLTPSEGELLKDPSPYRRLVDHLLCLTITRPDIAFSVHVLSQFMQQPRKPHLDAAHRVLRYLKLAPGQGILFPSHGKLQLKGYCDADWASCPTTKRSVTGFCVFLGGAPISWKSKKQSVVSRSSAESEYRSMASLTCELVWLKQLLCDLQVPHSQPTLLYCDNQAASHIATNPVFHECTKHIEIDCHTMREKIQLGLIKTTYVPSTQQIADIFTKPLGSLLFHNLLRKLGTLDIHSPA